MFLNTILTILTVVLITMTVLAVVWWKKHGKKLLNFILSMKGMMSNNPFGNGNTNQQGLDDLFGRLNKLNEMFGKTKK